jgi:hypothetical protein
VPAVVSLSFAACAHVAGPEAEAEATADQQVARTRPVLVSCSNYQEPIKPPKNSDARSYYARVRITVTPGGQAQEASVIRTGLLLGYPDWVALEARDAALSCHFEPATEDGAPVWGETVLGFWFVRR